MHFAVFLFSPWKWTVHSLPIAAFCGRDAVQYKGAVRGCLCVRVHVFIDVFVLHCIHTCTYVCVYVWRTCLRTHLRVCSSRLYIPSCVTCICVYVYLRIRIGVSVHVTVYLYARIFVLLLKPQQLRKPFPLMKTANSANVSGRPAAAAEQTTRARDAPVRLRLSNRCLYRVSEFTLPKQLFFFCACAKTRLAVAFFFSPSVCALVLSLSETKRLDGHSAAAGTQWWTLT